MTVDSAFNLLSVAIDSGHAANGYLIVGDLKEGCLKLTEALLRKLFPKDVQLVATRSHPDVVYLEPQGKSRTIKVERPKDASSAEGPGMRDGLLEPMSTTAFAGGWKVGVIVGADRLQVAAANAFLKLLEEPPPKTVFLLLTDQPDAILPTIVSRTQRLDLPLRHETFEGDSYRDLAEIFESKGVDGVFRKSQAAKRLAEILGELKDSAEDEDVALVRKAFYKTVLAFVRRWMIDGSVPAFRAYRNLEAVEEAYAQSEKYLSDEMVLSFMMDRLTFPEG